MLRLIVLALCCSAACGRIAFDARSDGGTGTDAVGDASSDGAALQPVYVAHSLTGVASAIYGLEPTTGQLTLIGNVPLTHGELTGLTVKDANTLYAVTFTGQLLSITLSPFDINIVTTGLGAPVGLEILAGSGDLMLLDESVNTIGVLTLAPPTLQPQQQLVDLNGPLFIDADGGDLYPIADADYYVWTNSTFGLYQIDSSNGQGSLLGTSTNQIYIVGLTMLDGQLYGLGRDSNALHPINPTTGQIGAGVTLCLSCPTPFDLEFGDIAASPTGS